MTQQATPQNMSNFVDAKYHLYLRDILKNGSESSDRTSTGTIRVFGRRLRFDLQRGFPLITTKEVWMYGIVQELVWFLSGETNIQPLVQAGVSIWTDWPYKVYREHVGDTPSATYPASKEEFEQKIAEDDDFAKKWGGLGRVYGAQWRQYRGRHSIVDQITRLIENLQYNPESRRHIVDAWNPAEVEDMALPPCHYAFQCFVEDGKLSLMWQQRSVDSFLGLPFNIASYALLTHMLAQQAGLEVGELIFSGGDCHIYKNHLEQVHEQLSRTPRESPELHLNSRDGAVKNNIEDYTIHDVWVKGYNPHPVIEAPIAV